MRPSRSAGRAAVVCAALAVLLPGGLGVVATASSNFLWKVTRGEGAFYLAGSVHMLTAAHYPLDPAFDRAFADADLLVEEVDYQEMLAPEAQMRMLTRGMFTGGGSLRTAVSADTYQLAAKRVAALGLPMGAMERFKPWFLALTLAGMEWQQAGFDQQLGLDRHFYDRAVAAGMPVQGLETIDYQISRFDEMTAAEQEGLLASTLRELESQKGSVADIAQAWRSGDVATVERLVLQDLKTETRVYERLLVERNANWMPALEALALRPGRAFVVVGAAHLVGPDGLLALLQARGYGVEQM